MITVRAAALKLGISERRVRALLLQGRIAGQRINPRMWLVEEPVRIAPAPRTVKPR